MASLWADNEKLMHDQEKNLKSLYDRQNHWNLVPNSGDNGRDEE